MKNTKDDNKILNILEVSKNITSQEKYLINKALNEKVKFKTRSYGATKAIKDKFIDKLGVLHYFYEEGMLFEEYYYDIIKSNKYEKVKGVHKKIFTIANRIFKEENIKISNNRLWGIIDYKLFFTR